MQEFTANVERLRQLAWTSVPGEQHLVMQGYIDGLQDLELTKILLLGDHRSLGTALIHVPTLDTARMTSYSNVTVRGVTVRLKQAGNETKKNKDWQPTSTNQES